MWLGWKLFLLVLVAAALLQFSVVLAPSLLDRTSVIQPIAFNHKKHAGELSLPCAMCHQSVESQAFAGVPQAETCITCHAAPLSQNPEEEKIRSYASKGEKIPWQRIYRMPGDVFFSHRRHVVLGKVECATCHGAMAEQVTPPPRPLVNQSMQWCINCHEQRRASADCNACHR